MKRVEGERWDGKPESMYVSKDSQPKAFFCPQRDSKKRDPRKVGKKKKRTRGKFSWGGASSRESSGNVMNTCPQYKEKQGETQVALKGSSTTRGWTSQHKTTKKGGHGLEKGDRGTGRVGSG